MPDGRMMCAALRHATPSTQLLWPEKATSQRPAPGGRKRKRQRTVAGSSSALCLDTAGSSEALLSARTVVEVPHEHGAVLRRGDYSAVAHVRHRQCCVLVPTQGVLRGFGGECGRGRHVSDEKPRAGTSRRRGKGRGPAEAQPGGGLGSGPQGRTSHVPVSYCHTRTVQSWLAVARRPAASSKAAARRALSEQHARD